MDHINNMIDKEKSPSEWKNWVNYLKKPTIKVFMKNNGSHLSKDWPFCYCEIEFPKSLNLEQVVTGFFGVDHRLQWDKDNTSHHTV